MIVHNSVYQNYHTYKIIIFQFSTNKALSLTASLREENYIRSTVVVSGALAGRLYMKSHDNYSTVLQRTAFTITATNNSR